MADQDDEDVQSHSTWPAPPPFWKHFSAENLSRIDTIRQQQVGQDGAKLPPHVRIPDLPRTLWNLQPPPEPPNRQWRVFGANYTLQNELPSLEEQEMQRLLPRPDDLDQDGKHFDRAIIMKRLAKSLLLNFLELVGVLGIDVEQAAEKVADIRTLFINFHHLINEYRPHQARESLIAMMQAQLDRMREETNAIRDVREKAERILEGLGSLQKDGFILGREEDKHKVEHLEHDKDMWQLVAEIAY